MSVRASADEHEHRPNHLRGKRSMQEIEADQRRDRGRIGVTLCAVAAVLVVFGAVVGISRWRAWRRANQPKPMSVIIRSIERGPDPARVVAIRSLERDVRTPADFAAVLPALRRAIGDRSEAVRNVSAALIGETIIRLGGRRTPTDRGDPAVVALCPKAADALVPLLTDPSPILRMRAATSLQSAASAGRLDTPSPALVACLDDPDTGVRVAAAECLAAYRNGPELLIPTVLRRLPDENPFARRALLRTAFPFRLDPDHLPLLLESLDSKDRGVRYAATVGINHMGPHARPALPRILALLRQELDAPPPADPLERRERLENDIVFQATGAVGQLAPDDNPPPEAVPLLRRVLQDESPQRRNAAAWSLGVLGRNSAAAVPDLLAAYRAAGDDLELRTTIPFALAEITAGTPDAPHVLKALATAWKTAPPEQKTPLSKVLRRLGPEALDLVPELRDLPQDDGATPIRRLLYPRSRYEQPMRFGSDSTAGLGPVRTRPNAPKRVSNPGNPTAPAVPIPATR